MTSTTPNGLPGMTTTSVERQGTAAGRQYRPMTIAEASEASKSIGPTMACGFQPSKPTHENTPHLSRFDREVTGRRV